jgi:hypothetical protein
VQLSSLHGILSLCGRIVGLQGADYVTNSAVL